MRVLVTGGSGYFGTTLRDRLRAQGHSVRNFDLVQPDADDAQDEFVQGDIRDAGSVSRACEGIDVVHHNVAQVPLAKSRALFDSVNIEGTEVMLAAARSAGVKKLVYTSSSAVFGVPASNPVTERTLPHPAEAYGRAKYEAERRCEAYVREGADITIIRPRTILGHGRLGIFQILFEWIRTGSNIPVLGDGDNVYQFVHADDLADACIRAGERAGAAVYNCGTDRYGTMRETLEALCRHAGTGSKVRSVSMSATVWGMKVTSALGLSPLMYGRSMYFDLSAIERDLGWRPRWSNEEMFIESYDWYLANRERVLASSGASHHRSPVKQGVLELVRRLL